MSVVKDFAFALGDMTPAEIGSNMDVIADEPWMSIVKIKTPHRTVWNLSFDKDGSESFDILSALELLPLGSQVVFRTDQLRTLGCDREVTYQFIS